MKRAACLLLFLMLMIPGALAAVKADIDGSFRMRMENLSKFNLDPSTKGIRDWSDARVRIVPTISVNEYLVFRAQIDVVETFSGAPSVSSNHPGINTDLFQNGVEFFYPNYAFIDFNDEKIGRLRVGRIPFDWGYGLWYNSGSDDFADSYAGSQKRGNVSGLIYDLYIGRLDVGLGMSIISEKSIDEVAGDTADLSDDEVSTFLFSRYKTDHTETGLLLNRYWLTSYENSKVGSSETDIGLFFRKKGSTHWGFEVGYSMGKIGRLVLDDQSPRSRRWGVYGTIGQTFLGILNVNLDLGVASGERDMTQRREAFEAHQDFNPAFILFNEAGGGEIENTDVRSRYFTNAYMLKPWVEVETFRKIYVGTALIWAQARMDTAENPNKKLGTEVDAWLRWNFHEKISVFGGLGYLRTSKALSYDPPDAEPADPIVAKGQLVMHF